MTLPGFAFRIVPALVTVLAGTAGCGGSAGPAASPSACRTTAHGSAAASPSPCSTILAQEPGEPASPSPDAQTWQGAVTVHITVASPAGTCAGPYRASIVLSVPPAGSATGSATVTDAPVNSCGKTTFARVGQRLPVTAKVRDHTFIFSARQFTPGDASIAVPMAAPGYRSAHGTGTSRRQVDGTVITSSLTFDLRCITCG